MTDPDPPPRRPGRSPASRVLGPAARGAERLAGATGLDRAVEDVAEEAIVRALRSPAVERAVQRLIEEHALDDAVGRALSSDQVAEAIVRALDSEVADHVWEELLASDKAQMLVERIAAAPEVRAALAQQGVGMLTDIGRRLTVVTEALDDAAERVVHGLLRRDGHEDETNQVGLVTRTLAAGIDLGLLAGAFSIVSGLLASIIPFAFGDGDRLPLGVILALVVLTTGSAGAVFVAFWALVGQTPGMRFLSIRLAVDGSPEVSLRCAIRRLLAIPLALAPAGLGFLAVLLSPTRQGWHDRIAGTEVVYDERATAAPWSTMGRREAPDPTPARAD